MRADGSVSLQDGCDVHRVGQKCTLVLRLISEYGRVWCAVQGVANIKNQTLDYYGGGQDILNMYCFLCVYSTGLTCCNRLHGFLSQVEFFLCWRD